MNRLGMLIKNKRESEGLSLRDFAEKCDLSHSYIKNLEEADPRTGKEIVPSIDSLEKLSRALNMPFEELLREAGYLHDTRVFEPSNLKLIRGGKSFVEISNDIALKTGNKIDPAIYQSIEDGSNTNPSAILIDTLARYVGVDRYFFYRKNSPEDFKNAQTAVPYISDTTKECPLYFSDNPVLLEFVSNPDNEDYLYLAKELSEKKIKVKLVKRAFFLD